MNATSIQTRTHETVSDGVDILVVVVSVVFSLTALLTLTVIVYMLVRTSHKRSLDVKPETEADKLRKVRLSLGLGDLEPKMKRELVTLKTNNYNMMQCSMWNNKSISTPIKCHL